ncbi:MAG: glycosyltransferase [Geminicoccaceae bacterium]
MSKKLFYRGFFYQKKDMARFLAEDHDFDILYRDASPPVKRQTKFFFVKHAIFDVLFLLKRLRQIRRYDYILALWHAAPAFMLLKRFGLIHYEKMLWFGFSVHSSFWGKLYRLIAKLDKKNTWFVVFTEQEIENYARRLGIPPSRLLFIPHGDWPQPIQIPDVFAPDPDLDLSTPFYFAGGFTNRNYAPVIETFRKLGHRLIIVCSSTNTDVVDAELPANISVYRDITFENFELLLAASKAVIIPLRYDAGAAGHSVLVRSMRNGKIVIANDFRIIDDYIENDVDGVLVADLEGALQKAITDIEADGASYERIREAARQRFARDYSQDAMERMMSDLIEGRPIRSRSARRRQEPEGIVSSETAPEPPTAGRTAALR